MIVIIITVLINLDNGLAENKMGGWGVDFGIDFVVGGFGIER